MFRSTKGASKQRRDLINGEITVLRDLLPLPEAARQRLSQLQIMSLACVYIRKCNFFTTLYGENDSSNESSFEFTQTLTGFLLVASRDGKLLYISDNVTEYLGHSMVDMMTQGDSIYDIIDKRDHQLVQTQLLSGQANGQDREDRAFFCKMNVARSFRRQAGFGDHKMMHIKGHFVQPVMHDNYGNQPVFMAMCTPLITPDVKETAIQNSTFTFYSVHGLDMKYTEIGHIGEYYLGYDEQELSGRSWYELLHPEDVHEAKEKHVQLIKSSHEMGCMLTARVQSKFGSWVWMNIVMHIRQPFVCDNGDPAIVCINHVIDDNEAQLFKIQSQLYSSHIARSPEFLGSPQGCSPQHTITQVPVEGGNYPGQPYGQPQSQQGSDERQALQYSVSFFSSGSSPSQVPTAGGDQQHGTMPTMFIDTTSDSSSGSLASNQPTGVKEEKQRLRADLVNKLKRKLSDSNGQQCRPTKISRVVNTDNNGGMSSGTGTTSYQASAVITDVSLFDTVGHGFSSMNSGDIQVLAPIQRGPCYQNIVLRKQAIINRKNIEIELENVSTQNFSQNFISPPTPLTPDSLLGDDRNEEMTNLLNIDTSNNVILPSSLLTPEASPVSIYEDMVASPLADHDQRLDITSENDINDTTFFDDICNQKNKSPTAQSVGQTFTTVIPMINDQLPVIDTVSLEQMLCDLEHKSPTITSPVISTPQQQIKEVIVQQMPQSLTENNEEMLNQVVTNALIEMVQLAADGTLDLSRFGSLSGEEHQQTDMEQKNADKNMLKENDEALVALGSLAVMSSQAPIIDDMHILDELHQLTELHDPSTSSYGDCDLPSTLLVKTL